MRVFEVLSGIALLAVVLLDAFQSIILPRRPVGRLRITRLFFIATWQPWRRLASLLKTQRNQDQLYSVYGPLALLVLFFVWAVLLIFGFGLIFFGLRVPFHDPLLHRSDGWARFGSCLYVSGTTIFTLGLGDVVPQSHAARLWTVLEAGTGLGFIALVIGYVPVLYGAFSHREVQVAMLDARAGSPPTATELLLRHDFEEGPKTLRTLLAEWERWGAEMLETHVSYPILCYYRSQHDNQSWLAALTAILDTCTLMIAMPDGQDTRQAQLTFAIGRHVLVDLVHVFQLEAEERRLRLGEQTRLPEAERDRICQELRTTGFSPCSNLSGGETLERLQAMRLLYEPSACALAGYLRLTVPPWMAAPSTRKDTWALMKGLKTPNAEHFTSHVSARSTALHLETRDEDGL